MLTANSLMPGQSSGSRNGPQLPAQASDTAKQRVAENSARAGNSQANGKAQDAGRGDKLADDKVSLGSGVQSKFDTPEQVLKNFDPQKVVEGVAGPLEMALKRAAAEGASEDELAKMRDDAQRGIDKGFSQAQDIIKGLGLMSEELESVIGGARDELRTRLDDFNLADLIAGNASTERTELRAGSSQSNSFSFSVTTAEGDVVTINAARKESSMLEMIQQQGDQARELQAEWQGSWQESFALTVEGDLNEAEMSDLSDLMQQVDKVADKFFSGRYEAAFAKAERLDLSGDALVSMSLDMTQKTVSVAEYSAMAAGGELSNPGRGQATDWVSPLREYAQGLVGLQQQEPGWLQQGTWLDLLQAHPKPAGDSMMNFADTMKSRQTL